jgi:hypothetical protein
MKHTRKFSLQKLLFALITCLAVAGCTTIRMKYESTVEVEGVSQPYTYINSYPVGGAHASLCMLTGIFFGGYCWYYLVMPTVLQKGQAIQEAQNRLPSQLAGKKFEEVGPYSVSKVSFDEGTEEIRIGNSTGNQNP